MFIYQQENNILRLEGNNNIFRIRIFYYILCLNYISYNKGNMQIFGYNVYF